LDHGKYKQTNTLYRFGSFRLDVEERRLWRENEAISLASKQFDLLVYFVENAGRIAKKSDLLDAVWTDTYVEETTLARNVSWLRKLLEDGENAERIIETVPKLGYRFTAKVTLSEPEENLLVVEEQITQHFRGEETLTISDAEISDAETPEREEITQIERRRPVSRRFEITWSWLIAFGFFALAGIAFPVYQYLFKKDSANPIVAANVVPLTAATGYEDTPVFSPDGKFVAYSWNGGKDGEYGARDIYVKAVTTGEPRRLTDTEANEHYPIFSPDGLQIAFIRGKYGTPGDLMMIPLLGGTERRLARVFSGNYSISFSPDGSQIAVIDTADSSESGQYAVYLIDIKTGERRRVTNPAEFEGETTPRFSPDGKNLAFIRIAPTVDKQRLDNQDIFIVPVAGGEPTQLTFDKSTINSLTWNADGDRIYFASYRQINQLRLWSVAQTGGEPAIIATGGKDVRNIAVSADGKKLIFSERNRRRFIWRIPADGTPARKLTNLSNDEFYPQISPDGSQIAYHMGFGENGESFNPDFIQIWLADANGGNPRQVTNESKPARNPQFSPDGSQIAFNSANGQESVNYTIATDGGNLRRISPEGWFDDFPVWSRDGEFIFFISKQTGERNIWKIKADGRSAPVQITTGGAYRAFPAADGKFLYYIKENFASQFDRNREFPEHLWRVSTSGETEEPVPKFSVAGFFGIFTVAPEGVYFLAASPDRKLALKLYDFADEKIKAAPGDYKIPSEIDKEFIFKDVISANGKVLLCTVSTHTSRVMIADLP